MNLSRRSFVQTTLGAASLALLLQTAHAAEPALQLKDNDVWVMAGDSITAQRQHTNFIEAYYRTRFPNLKLHFRNSGIGGNTTGSVLARFDYDVAAWKPTIVSIELGMNDVNGKEESYINGMKKLIEKIRAIPAQPVLISSSPVDDGSKMNDWKSPRCEKIHPFTEALKKLADEEKVVFVDQYHPLIDLWGDNRRKGEEQAVKNGTWPPKPKPATPAPATTPNPAAGPTPVPKPVPAPIAPSLIPLTGDPVHPGAVGQYNMAAVILKGFKAPGEVSSATLKADGKVVEEKRCKITDVSAKDGNLTFTRLDEASPWPIQPAAKATLKLMPEIAQLSQYLLKVEGLTAGDYKVNINGKTVATVSAKDLATGWNIASAVDGPLGDRANAIATLIGKLQGPLNLAWRDASKGKNAPKAATETDDELQKRKAMSAEKLVAAEKAIDEAEAELQKLVQPVAWKFEIVK